MWGIQEFLKEIEILQQGIKYEKKQGINIKDETITQQSIDVEKIVVKRSKPKDNISVGTKN